MVAPAKFRARRRAEARSFFDAGLAAADPRRCVFDALAAERWQPRGSWGLLALGKGAAGMTSAAVAALGSPATGVLISHQSVTAPATTIQSLVGEHPVPGAGSLRAGEVVERWLEQAPAQLLVLLSGGGSALLSAPPHGVPAADKQRVVESLLLAGADIHELNTVRKHLSRVKGGRLARSLAGREALVLVLSDVVDDDLATIASGPLVADPTTFEDALGVLERRLEAARVPVSVLSHLQRGRRGEIAEAPGDGEIFAAIRHQIVAGNRGSVDRVAARARRAGYQVVVSAEPVVGEASAVGRELAERAVGRGAQAPWALVGGGETTVRVQGSGSGGRNQELVLAFALALECSANEGEIVCLSAGTDGRDGPTDAAGGVVDRATAERIRAQGLDPVDLLRDNDSHRALQAAGDLVITGPTGTNVADLVVVLGGSASAGARV